MSNEKPALQLKQILDQFQGKKPAEQKQESDKQLVQFKEEVLDSIDKIDIRLTAFPSSFGVRKVSDNETLRKNYQHTIRGTKDRLKSLVEQLKTFADKSLEAKRMRILNQSKLILEYRERGMPKEFIESMISSMKEEYEIEVAIGKEIIKIYVDEINYAQALSDELELFRERCIIAILEDKVSKQF